MQNNTKAIIEQAVIDLCTSMPFSKLRVNDICKKADISKQTFYNYFQDKYDVAASIYLQDAQNDTLLESGHSYDALLKGVRKIWEKRDFYRSALEGDGQNSLLSVLKKHSIEQVTEEIIAKKGRELTHEEKYLVTYMTYGWIGGMVEWLEGRLDYSVEEFAEIEGKSYPPILQKILYEQNM